MEVEEMKATVLTARRREESGKGPARRIRREGLVPAIIYGRGDDPMMVSMSARELKNLLAGDSSMLVTVDVEGMTFSAVIKEVVHHPLREDILHLDLQRVRMDEEITAFVPVMVVGEEECEGLSMGGVLQHGLRDVEVAALPADLPSHLEVDIAGLSIGDSVHVADIALPAGVRILTNLEDVAASILAPALYEEKVVEEEVAEEEGVAEEEAAQEEHGEERTEKNE